MEGVIPVIIPAYEPDDRMLVLLNTLAVEQIKPILIINDGSGDEYTTLFERSKEIPGVILLEHEKNKGKGAALKTAFKYCLENMGGGELKGCVTADSDGQHSISAIKRCMYELVEHNKTFVLGVRNFTGKDIPAKSQFGNNLTRKVFKRLYKVDISDTQTGLRGIPVEFMRKILDVPGNRFEYETRVLISAVEQDIDICEIPIETIYDSKENHSTHFRPIVDSVKIYWVFCGAFCKFLISSFSSSLIDLTVFQILCIFIRHDIVPYIAIATVGARVISTIYNYLMNYFVVFGSNERHSKSVTKYFALAITQMSCSAALVSILCNVIAVPIELVIKIPVDVVLFFISFIVQKKWVY